MHGFVSAPGTDAVVRRPRAAPSFAELDAAKQFEASNAVDRVLTEYDVRTGTDALRVVLPELLTPDVQAVFAARESVGYPVPIAVRPDDSIVVAGPRPLPTEPGPPSLSRFLIVWSALIVSGMVLGAIIGAVVGLAPNTGNSVTSGIVFGGVGGGLACIGHFYVSDIRKWWHGRRLRRFLFTAEQVEQIRNRSIRRNSGLPELLLSDVAEHLTSQIVRSHAWQDQILADHKIVFAPDVEADQVREHAVRIAAARIRLGHAPQGTTSDHQMARAAIDAETRVLDQITASLHQRVAALWVYADTVRELSSQLDALRAINGAHALRSQVDALARQTGLDEMAVHQMRALTVDAESLSVRIGALTQTLTNTLRPVAEPTAPALR